MNRLTEAGRAAMRTLLLRELELTQWNLSHCAERLRLTDASAVRREVRRLGLVAQYEQARRVGLVSRNGHRGRVDLPDP